MSEFAAAGSDDEIEEQTKVKIDPTQTSEFWKNKGNDQYKGKNYGGAVDSYSKAIGLDPTNALLYTNRAAAYLMLLSYKEAKADCDQAISLDVNCSKAFFRKATALKGLGDLDGAIDALTTGLAVDPTNSTGTQERQSLLAAKNKIEQVKRLVAANSFTQALVILEALIKEIGGNFREINLMKVQALIHHKRYEEAINLTNTMMRSAQNGDTELLGLRAKCLFAMGEVESAVKHLQQAVRSDPDNSVIRNQYKTMKEIEDNKSKGDDSFKSSNFHEAINNWTAAINLVKDTSPSYSSKIYLNRATALFKLKKYDDAIKDSTKAIYLNRSYVKAYIRRAECYSALGGPENITKAISDYEEAVELENDEDIQSTYKEKLKKAKVALKRSKRKDLYAILGVNQSANENEIKSAYRKAALRLHPDKQASKSEEEKKTAETQFKAVNEAYEILSNPEKKARYDSGIEVEDLDNPHAGGYSGYGGGGYDDDDDGGYGGRGGRGGMHGGHGHGGMDPNVLFQMFMQQQGGGGGGFRFG